MKKVLWLLGACLFAGNGLQAQEISSFKDSVTLDEVTISARRQRHTEVLKSPVPLREMPISVSQVPARLLQDLSLDRIDEATRYSTGVKPIDTYGGFMTWRLRGFYNFVLMVDGVRDERHNLSQSATSTSMSSVERIEILKGPASVLYGHSALGGVINIMRKQPSDEFHINAQAGVGSWGRYNVKVGGSGALSKKVNIRLDASMADGEGWRRSYDRTANMYAALDYNIDSRNKLEFRVGGNNDFYGTEAGQPHVTRDLFNVSDGKQAYAAGDLPAGIDRRQRYNDPQDFLTHKGYNITAKWLHDINADWKLSEYLSYFDDDNDYFNTESLVFPTSDTPREKYDYFYMNGDKKVYMCLDSIKRSYPLRFAYHAKTLQNQFEVTGKFNTGAIPHKVAAGYSFTFLNRNAYSSKANGVDGFGPGQLATISTINPVLNQGYFGTKFSSKTYLYQYMHGVFVQDYIEFIPELRALVGLRFDRYDRFQRKATTNDKTVLTKDPRNHVSNNALTWRLGLVYQINKAVNAYGSATNYFRPTNTIATDGYVYLNNKGEKIDPSGDNVFDPETGYQFEVGSHLALSNTLQVNLSAYYIHKKNMVESSTLEDGTRISAQIGATGSKGIELDVNYNPIRSLRIHAGYTFNQTKYLEYATNEYITNSLTGNYYTQCPEQMLFGWLFYDFNSGALNGLSLGIGAEYSSEAWANSTNTISYDPYAVAHFSANYTFRKHYRIQLNVNNLFDKTYYRNGIGTQFVPEQGRNALASFSFIL